MKVNKQLKVSWVICRSKRWKACHQCHRSLPPLRFGEQRFESTAKYGTCKTHWYHVHCVPVEKLPLSSCALQGCKELAHDEQAMIRRIIARGEQPRKRQQESERPIRRTRRRAPVDHPYTPGPQRRRLGVYRRFEQACRLACMKPVRQWKEKTNLKRAQQGDKCTYRAPLTFRQLVQGFLADNPEIKIHRLDYVLGRFFDLDIAERFVEYHERHADLMFRE